MRYRSFTYLLGSMDLEMGIIQRLLKNEKCIVVNATVNGFDEVRASGAYSAAEEPSPSTVWIECSPKGGKQALKSNGAVLIDHHHEGDPGYEVGPENYMAGSSIGQLIYFMVRNGYEPQWESVPTSDNDGYSYSNNDVYLTYQGIRFTLPEEFKYTAAADHCLAHAYIGHCPAINVEKLKSWRIEKLAIFRNMNAVDLAAAIEDGKKQLLRCPRIDMGVVEVLDARSCYIKELKEAGAHLGMSVVSAKSFYHNDGAKIVLHSVNDDLISYFMEVWGPKIGLASIYGNPKRGLAGGFLYYKNLQRK